MRNYLLTFVLILCIADKSYSQIYTQLTPGSNIACVSFPNGTSKLAQATADGYSLVSKDRVKKLFQGDIDRASASIERFNKLQKEIKKEGNLPRPEMKQVLIASIKFMKGKLDILNPGIDIPVSKSEQVALIDIYIAKLKAIKKAAKFSLKAADDCINHKQIIPKGHLLVEIAATQHSVAAVLWGKSSDYFTGSNYCIRGDQTEAITINSFVEDPCGPVATSCGRKGYLGMYLSGVYSEAVLDSQGLTNATAEIMEQINNKTFEVKLQEADKNYQLIPCNVIFGVK